MAPTMAALDLGAIIRFRPELLHGMAMSELAGTDRVKLLGHGGGSMSWSLVERPDGRRVRVLHGDIEDALIPNYVIRGQTHMERRLGGGDPVKKLDKYCLVDIEVTDQLSICGWTVDPTCSLPLARWETLGDCAECEENGGDAARDQVEREKRKPIHWEPMP
jgi:hypothetical protein